jgi:type VI secretion system secreted protein Hcp
MRNIGLFAGIVLFAGLAFADGPAPVTVKFVPPQELAAKKGHDTPAEALYQLEVTVQGINAKTNQSWVLTIPARAYAIVSPRDAASGLPTGKRMHKPFTITLESSPSSPQLATAVGRGDKITLVVLHFKPQTPNGPHHALSIPAPENAAMKDEQGFPTVKFTFQKITWRTDIANKVATDDWETPVP